MGKFVLTLVLLCLFMQAMSQTEKRGSLLKLLPTAKEDTVKVRILLNLADVYETNNQDSSHFYLQEAKQLSSVLHFDRGLYLYYEQLMIVSFTTGQYDS